MEAGFSRGDLTEAELRILKDLLPIESKNRGRGRPPEQNRSIIDGILWRLRGGVPWRDVPPKYGSWNTIYRQFRRWSEVGVWEIVAVTLAEIMADTGHYSIDSTTVRAHVSAAGCCGGRRYPQGFNSLKPTGAGWIEEHHRPAYLGDAQQGAAQRK